MKRLIYRSLFALIAIASVAAAAAPNTASEKLTIASIYATNSLTGRAPNTVQWSPDGKKVAYMVHQPGKKQADLYAIGVLTARRSLTWSTSRARSRPISMRLMR